MKNLKNAMLALGLTSMFGLGACGGDLAKVEDLVNEMCACKDKACYDKVEEKAKKEFSDEKKMEKLMKDEPEAMGKLMAKAAACEEKLEAAEAPAEGE